jgi:hypothetical protein
MTITCPNGHKKRIFKRSIVGGKICYVYKCMYGTKRTNLYKNIKM